MMHLAVAALSTLLGAWPAPSSEAPPLVVTSFNIRYGTADDGPNAWPKRKELVFATLRDGGDLLGLQEALPFQVAEVATALPGFAIESRTREADPGEGEACPILYRFARFEADPDDRGTFWLSESPETPGSRSWDAALPRVATWIRLVERDGGRGLYVFNTHFDHRGAEARVRAAELLATRIAARKRPEEPVIVLGDFNAGPDSPPLRRLRAAGLVDAWRAAHPDAPERGTFHGWKDAVAGERIDFVLVTPGLGTIGCTLDDRRPDGRWPSDHLAVRAKVVRRAPPS